MIWKFWKIFENFGGQLCWLELLAITGSQKWSIVPKCAETLSGDLQRYKVVVDLDENSTFPVIRVFI